MQFVDWMARRIIMLSAKSVGSTLSIKKMHAGGEDDECSVLEAVCHCVELLKAGR